MDVTGLPKSSSNLISASSDVNVKLNEIKVSENVKSGTVGSGDKVTLSSEALAKLAAEQQGQGRNGGGTEPPDPPSNLGFNELTIRAMNGGGTEPPDPEKPKDPQDKTGS